MEGLIEILEYIGTVAFAASGAVVGFKKHMDIFGICMLGATTACGGGIVRDIMLGKFPPSAFCNGIYVLLATVVSVCVFIFEKRNARFHESEPYKLFYHIADSLGLGAFSIVGLGAVIDSGFGGNAFFTIALGVITGVGGGLLRDVMAGETPYIFSKHIYACASLAGTALAYVLLPRAGETVASLAGILTIIVIRFFAARGNWSLPRA